jgi:hypothetical protein
MNAPVRLAEAEPLADIEDFRECAADYAWFYRSGWLEKADAVDWAQRHAELWGLVDIDGQDTIQLELAAAFARVPAAAADYASDILMRWDLADPRDRWRWSSEAPPLVPNDEPGPRSAYRTPQSTIDAFLYVARNESTEYLADWLARHPLDAQHLQKIWKHKCTVRST